MPTPRYGKRHYVDTAAILASVRKRHPKPEDQMIVDEIAGTFSQLYGADNGAFQWDRFLLACAGEPISNRRLSKRQA